MYIAEYPVIKVVTVHESGLFSSCDRTVVYYQDMSSVKQDNLKTCGSLDNEVPMIHIINDSNEKVLVGTKRDWNRVIEIYITEDTFKNNLW